MRRSKISCCKNFRMCRVKRVRVRIAKSPKWEWTPETVDFRRTNKYSRRSAKRVGKVGACQRKDENERRKIQLTFRRYCEILSPCSHGMTQPFDILQSNARPLLAPPPVMPVPMPFPFALKLFPYGWYDCWCWCCRTVDDDEFTAIEDDDDDWMALRRIV